MKDTEESTCTWEHWWRRGCEFDFHYDPAAVHKVTCECAQTQEVAAQTQEVAALTQDPDTNFIEDPLIVGGLVVLVSIILCSAVFLGRRLGQGARVRKKLIFYMTSD